ncbi:MAG: prepilin-type N-terminal cleavage/methylation domain-containing protein [Azoarcus sp.]|jgi:general secretion pathway protein J|nr:prepilin-type N-terminal cleavage/methylation domain-containing protein [Azoarcus sp.]
MALKICLRSPIKHDAGPLRHGKGGGGNEDRAPKTEDRKQALTRDDPLRKQPAGIGARGFTLIEVVIALALMSLIMLGLVSAFATLGKTAARLDERAGKSGREWLLGEFLRAALSSSVGQIKQTLPDQREAIHFRGGPTSLQWLGGMPARHGVGGLHLFMLGLERCGSVACLALRYAPYVKDAPAEGETQVLVENVTGFRIAYQSHPARIDEEAAWRDDWDDADNLPARVRIELAVENAAWPPMLATLGAIDAASGRRVQIRQRASPSPPFQTAPSP